MHVFKVGTMFENVKNQLFCSFKIFIKYIIQPILSDVLKLQYLNSYLSQLVEVRVFCL